VKEGDRPFSPYTSVCRTDRQTDGQTDMDRIAIPISHVAINEDIRDNLAILQWQYGIQQNVIECMFFEMSGKFKKFTYAL